MGSQKFSHRIVGPLPLEVVCFEVLFSRSLGLGHAVVRSFSLISLETILVNISTVRSALFSREKLNRISFSWVIRLKIYLMYFTYVLQNDTFWPKSDDLPSSKKSIYIFIQCQLDFKANTWLLKTWYALCSQKKNTCRQVIFKYLNQHESRHCTYY